MNAPEKPDRRRKSSVRDTAQQAVKRIREHVETERACGATVMRIETVLYLLGEER